MVRGVVPTVRHFKPEVGKTYQKPGDVRIVVDVVGFSVVWKRPTGKTEHQSRLENWIRWVMDSRKPGNWKYKPPSETQYKIKPRRHAPVHYRKDTEEHPF